MDSLPDHCELVYNILLSRACFQLHLLRKEMQAIKPEDLEFFFNKNQGVIGIDGQPKVNPRVKIVI